MIRCLHYLIRFNIRFLLFKQSYMPSVIKNSPIALTVIIGNHIKYVCVNSQSRKPGLIC